MKGSIIILSLFVFLTVIFSSVIFAARPAAAFEPEIEASSAILADAYTGQILYRKNPDLKLSPASITKIMTMLVAMDAVERGDVSLDDPVTISRQAVKVEGSRIHLSEGLVWTLGDLLEAVAIVSANDASVAVAQHVAGPVEQFVTLMNKKAKQLGMVNTQFKNPEGLDEEGHYTTAYDIYLMSAELIKKHPKVLEWTSTWLFNTEGKSGISGVRSNTNTLLRKYKDLDGLKTGHTEKAGYCLAATAERDGTRLISVVMGTASESERDRISADLLDYGFKNFTRVSLVKKDETVGLVSVKNGRKLKVEAVASEDLGILTEKGNEDDVSLKIIQVVPEAPVKKGELVGYAAGFKGKEEIARIPLLAGEDVPEANIFVRLFRAFIDFIRGLFMRER